MQLFKSEVIRGEKKWFFEMENEEDIPSVDQEDEDDIEERNNMNQYNAQTEDDDD